MSVSFRALVRSSGFGFRFTGGLRFLGAFGGFRALRFGFFLSLFFLAGGGGGKGGRVVRGFGF